jgi:hypothetical protein
MVPNGNPNSRDLNLYKLLEGKAKQYGMLRLFAGPCALGIYEEKMKNKFALEKF